MKLTRPPGFRGRFTTVDEALSPVRTASGILTSAPRALAAPADAADVATLVDWAHRTGTPLTPRAAGTGMPGGNIGTGVVVDMLDSFRRILEIDPEAATARVQPGITLGALNWACAAHGLHVPVDPSSGERCTLGGMVANNAAGAHSVRHGATRAWVRGVKAVLADGTQGEARRGEAPNGRLGEIARALGEQLEPDRTNILDAWPRLRKNSSGYALREFLESGDVVDLIVGSEGTLAVLTEVELALAPVPRHRGLILAEFTSLEAAGKAVQAVLPAEPATCEMLDRTFLELVRAAGADHGYPLRTGLEAVLLLEVDADTVDGLDVALGRVRDALGGIAARITTAADPTERERFWSLRRAASPLIAERADGRVSMQFIEDGVVPVERLPEYVRALRRVLAAHDLPAVIFGHAGDGNLHVNPLVDVSVPAWRDTLDAVLYEVAAEVARLGGTLAGEHGDGRLRAPLLETIWGIEMVRRFRRVKEEFDPLGLLNPGVILPLSGQRPLDSLDPCPAPERNTAR